MDAVAGTRKEFAMVAPNKTRRLVCTIVRVAEDCPVDSSRFIRKPSTLVPWADPYIAGLVRRLQSEVRMERAEAADRGETLGSELFDERGAAAWLAQSAVADLDPPSPTMDDDWQWSEMPRWSFDEEVSE